MQLLLKRKRFLAFGVGLMAVMLIGMTGCDPFNSNKKHPTDTKLLDVFNKNEKAFNNLVEMSNADSNVIRVAGDFTRLETNWAWPRPESQLGFTIERWDEYRSVFRRLGLESGFSRESNSNGVTILFTASSKGMTFRGSSKGIAYSDQILSPTFESLEQQELKPANEKHGIIYKKIKDGWYLYFDW